MKRELIIAMHPKGIILTGGPNSCYEPGSPICDKRLFGLGVRIIGEVTAEKVKIVQEADAIFREELESANLTADIGQYFAAFTKMRSVGCMGESSFI